MKTGHDKRRQDQTLLNKIRLVNLDKIRLVDVSQLKIRHDKT